MGFDVRFKFPRVLGHPGAAHQLSMLFKHPHIIGVDLVGAVASWIALWLFGHRRGRCSRGSIWRRLARWDRPCLRWLPTRARIRVLDGRKTIPPWSVLHWLFSSWWWLLRAPSMNSRHRRAVRRLLRFRASWQKRASPGRGVRNRLFRYDYRFAFAWLRRCLSALNCWHLFRRAPGLRPFTWEERRVYRGWKRNSLHGLLVPLLP
jgi:hypothetical protein